MDPLSAEGLRQSNTYGGAVKERLARLLQSAPAVAPTNAAQAPIGAGMAAEAKKVLMSIPYQKHLQESKALGQEPMTPEEFSQVMGVGR